MKHIKKHPILIFTAIIVGLLVAIALIFAYSAQDQTYMSSVVATVAAAMFSGLIAITVLIDSEDSAAELQNKQQKVELCNQITRLTAEFCSCVKKVFLISAKLNKTELLRQTTPADMGQFSATLQDYQIEQRQYCDEAEVIMFQIEMLLQSHDLKVKYQRYEELKNASEAATIAEVDHRNQLEMLRSYVTDSIREYVK